MYQWPWAVYFFFISWSELNSKDLILYKIVDCWNSLLHNKLYYILTIFKHELWTVNLSHFYALAYIEWDCNVRMSVCVCMHVCHEISRTRSGRTVAWSQSYRSWQVDWTVDCSSLRMCAKCCGVTWPWPSHLPPKWPLQWKSPCETTVWFIYSKCFNGHNWVCDGRPSVI